MLFLDSTSPAQSESEYARNVQLFLKLEDDNLEKVSPNVIFWLK